MRINHEKFQATEKSVLNTFAGAVAIKSYSHDFFHPLVRLFLFAVAMQNPEICRLIGLHGWMPGMHGMKDLVRIGAKGTERGIDKITTRMAGDFLCRLECLGVSSVVLGVGSVIRGLR
jgi:hypothetical protein